MAGVEILNEIIINYNSSEKRFATKENDTVTKVFIQQPQDQSRVGNIYVGKVVDVKNGMNAAFIDIGSGKHGYLHRDQIPDFLHSKDSNKHMLSVSKFAHVGKKLIVQVKKDETMIKGPLLTAIIEFPGDKMVYLPEGEYIAVSKKGNELNREKWRNLVNKHKIENEGFIIRTDAFESSESDWLCELGSLRKAHSLLQEIVKSSSPPALILETSLFENELLHELKRLKKGTFISDDQGILTKFKQRIQTNIGLKWEFQPYYRLGNIFSTYKIESEIEKALKRLIWLDNGSYLVIDETEALISIDVNTGKFTGNKNLQDTVLTTNLLAAKEIARQLTLRDYGGIILVDFIDMKSDHHQHLVQKAMQDELKKDSKYTRIVGFTSLGILQITRKKTKKSLSETLLAPCPVCSGTGKVESPETIAFRIERALWERPFSDHEAMLIEITEDVKSVFCGENNVHLHRIEQVLNIKIFFSVVHFCTPSYNIRQFGTIEELKAKEKTEG